MLKIKILGVPLDLGQERRGVDMGPLAVRAAGLNQTLRSLGHEVEDGGNIPVRLPEQQHFGDQHAKYLKEIAETAQEVAERNRCTRHWRAATSPFCWVATTRWPSARRQAFPSSTTIATRK